MKERRKKEEHLALLDLSASPQVKRVGSLFLFRVWFVHIWAKERSGYHKWKQARYNKSEEGFADKLNRSGVASRPKARERASSERASIK